MTTERELDTERMEIFAGKVMGALNGGATALGLSVGHRTGLFDTMAGMDPALSEEIAERAGLQERYVREWLGAMVTAGVVRYDPELGTYELPAEHGALLTRGAPSNLGVHAQYLAVLGGVEDRIVESFREGGGCHYHEYDRFHEVMAEDSAQAVVARLEADILPLVPGLQDRLEGGIDVLDVGCGAGRALCALAERYPRSRFAGVDLTEEAVALARETAAARGLGNVSFRAADAAELDDVEAYDLVCTFDAIHDQGDPAGALRAIRRALRTGGTYLMQEIRGSSYLENNLDHPLAPLLYTISYMHCMSVSLAADGAGLGTMWGRELAARLLAEAGFENVVRHTLDDDPMSEFYVMQV
ncbi:MAG: class I SAM-dependent methyltransferase [Gemmatimonadota bacterium]